MHYGIVYTHVWLTNICISTVICDLHGTEPVWFTRSIKPDTGVWSWLTWIRTVSSSRLQWTQ